MSPNACLKALKVNQVYLAASAQKAAELDLGLVSGSCCLLLQQLPGIHLFHPHGTHAERKGSCGM